MQTALQTLIRKITERYNNTDGNIRIHTSLNILVDSYTVKNKDIFLFSRKDEDHVYDINDFPITDGINICKAIISNSK